MVDARNPRSRCAPERGRWSRPPRSVALGFGLGFSGFLVFYGTAAARDSVEVRVVGTLRLEAHREDDGERTRIEGTVYDDLGRPLTSAVLRFSSVVGLCGRSTAPVANVPVRPDGDFCVELPSPTLSESLEVTAPDHESRSVTLQEIPPRSSPESGHLEIVELLRVWEPEAVERAWNIGLRWHGADRSPTVSGILHCSQTHHPLFVRTLESTGPTYVSVDTDPGAAAGPCRLELRSVEGVPLASGDIQIRRPVSVEVRPLEGGRYAARAGTKVAGTVSGMLEVRGADERYVAGATLDGSAAVFDLAHVADERLRVRYIPNQPWFAPGTEVSFDHVEPRPFFVRPWFHALLLTSLAALVFSRFIRKETGTRAPAIEGPSPRATSPRRARIHGVVRDAHTGEAIAQARLKLYEKTATESRLLAERTADAGGAFEFEQGPTSSLELEVSSPLHVTTRQPPRTGLVEVSLVARRRALLSAFRKFVQRQQVGRTAQGPFPTPERVRMEATLEARTGDATWAEAIDQLAFGPDEPEEPAVEALAVFPRRNHER